MCTISPLATVGALVTEQPSRSLVFEELDVDICVNGQKSLADVCAAMSLAVGGVIALLTAEDARRKGSQPVNWGSREVEEVASHVVATHHAYLRRALPRLSMLTSRVARGHGQEFPEVAELSMVFETFRAEAERHMCQEEGILFSITSKVDNVDRSLDERLAETVGPLANMTIEHDDAARALTRMHMLTKGYWVPEGACNGYRSMIDGLAELDRDMKQHLHIENHILFPRIMDRERSRAISVARSPQRGASVSGRTAI
ncbi:MAG: DUF542 domain-containing protein [Capsulimonadaceae bacterium]|nr:DUF542 domain-containing protein [Capsulimonadaceae bacterium]